MFLLCHTLKQRQNYTLWDISLWSFSVINVIMKKYMGIFNVSILVYDRGVYRAQSNILKFILDVWLDSEYVSVYENKYITRVSQRRSTQYSVKCWIIYEFLLWNSEYKSRELWTIKYQIRVFEKNCDTITWTNSWVTGKRMIFIILFSYTISNYSFASWSKMKTL